MATSPLKTPEVQVHILGWELRHPGAYKSPGGGVQTSPGNGDQATPETSIITERYILIEELKTWTEAQQYCREYHTDLVSIKNAFENEEIVKKAQGNSFWIGLFNEPWKWSHQGDNYTFHSWSYGQPNNRGGDQNCVVISNTGEWTDYDCNDQYSFFCCEDGSSGQCFYEGTWKTWQEAQSYCRNQSRDLPSIQDQARVNELIGLVPSMNFSEHWIGLYHDKENWQWSSGGDVIYTNWERYLFCASVNSGGEWEDSPCSKGNYFMCYSGHLHCMAAWNERKVRGALGKAVSTLVNASQLERNWYYMAAIIDMIEFLAVHEPPFRGSDESVDIADRSSGVFLGLYEYTLRKDPELAKVYQTIPGNTKCTLHDIQNEIIKIMCETVEEEIVRELGDSWYRVKTGCENISSCSSFCNCE
ncbi:UNVERIFIED_CONTAM: hypothetical protein FKN15_000382 [Acipenser sinensis]